MYLTHVVVRLIKTLKNKIYKYMTSISKNVHIDKLDDIVNKYNKIYHRTIKMKPVDVKDNTYINSGKESIDEDPKFKVGDHVRISIYKDLCPKGYTTSWSEEVFIIKKVLFLGHMLVVILKMKKLLERFLKKKFKKQTKNNLE